MKKREFEDNLVKGVANWLIDGEGTRVEVDSRGKHVRESSQARKALPRPMNQGIFEPAEKNS